MSPKEFEQSQCAHMYVRARCSWDFAFLAVFPICLQVPSAAKLQPLSTTTWPACLCTVRRRTGVKSISLLLHLWLSAMEELILPVTWWCPHRQHHSGSPHRSRGCLLAWSTALCKDKAIMPCPKRAHFCFSKMEPSLQDCIVPVHSLLC